MWPGRRRVDRGAGQRRQLRRHPAVRHRSHHGAERQRAHHQCRDDRREAPDRHEQDDAEEQRPDQRREGQGQGKVGDEGGSRPAGGFIGALPSSVAVGAGDRRRGDRRRGDGSLEDEHRTPRQDLGDHTAQRGTDRRAERPRRGPPRHGAAPVGGERREDAEGAGDEERRARSLAIRIVVNVVRSGASPASPDAAANTAPPAAVSTVARARRTHGSTASPATAAATAYDVSTHDTPVIDASKSTYRSGRARATTEASANARPTASATVIAARRLARPRRGRRCGVGCPVGSRVPLPCRRERGRRRRRDGLRAHGARRVVTRRASWRSRGQGAIPIRTFGPAQRSTADWTPSAKVAPVPFGDRRSSSNDASYH